MFAPLLCALTIFLACQESQPIPADVVDEVARCERVGRELYLSDNAAARGTDALMAKLGSLDDRGLGGYLAVHDLTKEGKPAETWTVLFMSDAEPVHVLYRVQVGPGKAPPKVLEEPEASTLPEGIRPLWAARALAIEKGGPYEQPINPVVLRGKDVGDEGLLVYLLAGTNEADVAVLGRHVRVRTDDQGLKLRELLPLTKSVIEIPTNTQAGRRVAMLTVTQILTDSPTEAHVFASLLYGIPLAVGTKRGVWKVADGKVLYLGPLSKPDTATLQLSLRTADKHARAGSVELFRVGIPAEPGFSAGDERVGRFQLPELGLAIPNLPPGTYRVLTDAHAARASDLVPSEVKLPRTEIVLDVVPPLLERESFLDLVDMNGKPFEAAELKSGSRRGKMRRPAWFHPRVKTEEDGSQSSTGFGGAFSESKSHRSYVKVVRGPRGFALGRDLEDSQLFDTSRSFDLRVQGHGGFAGSLSCDGSEAQYFRALLVEKGRFEGLFTMPDDSALDLERLFVSTPLEPDVEPRPSEWWLDVPVTVSIRATDCKPLKIEFRLRDGLPKPRRLERAE